MNEHNYNFKLRICIDIDVSTKFIFNILHFGVYRSSLNSLQKVKDLLKLIEVN